MTFSAPSMSGTSDFSAPLRHNMREFLDENIGWAKAALSVTQPALSSDEAESVATSKILAAYKEAAIEYHGQQMRVGIVLASFIGAGAAAWAVFTRHSPEAGLIFAGGMVAAGLGGSCFLTNWAECRKAMSDVDNEYVENNIRPEAIGRKDVYANAQQKLYKQFPSELLPRNTL